MMQFDAIIKITSTCICGSDLHMYTGAFPGCRKGDQLGHEVCNPVKPLMLSPTTWADMWDAFAYTLHSTEQAASPPQLP